MDGGRKGAGIENGGKGGEGGRERRIIYILKQKSPSFVAKWTTEEREARHETARP